jgi:basic membrane lipoprotein Med (substrate-binding protein (PBP1-ABC) superfamily)
MSSSRWVFASGAVAVTVAGVVSGAFGFPAARHTSFVVAGIHPGSVADAGIDEAQHDGLAYLRRHLPGVKVIEIGGVAPADAAVVMQGEIDRGADLIFAESPAYEQAVARVAARNPEVVFEPLDGSRLGANVGAYSANLLAVDYGLGVAAGTASKTGRIGFVASERTWAVESGVIAFLAGARSVDPRIGSALAYTGTRPDPGRETAAVVVSFLGSPIAVMRASERHRVLAVASFVAAARRFAPRSWLSGVNIAWGPAFVRLASRVRAGSWKATDWTASVAMHVAGLAPFGPRVPAATRRAAARAVALVESGRQATALERRGSRLAAAGATREHSVDPTAADVKPWQGKEQR